MHHLLRLSSPTGRLRSGRHMFERQVLAAHAPRLSDYGMDELLLTLPTFLQWLKSLSDSRYSFNSIFGKCPLCSTPISVKIA